VNPSCFLSRAGSSVLRRGQAPPLRACPAHGYSPSRTALLSRQGQRRYPGSRACCFVACPGSTTTGDSPRPRHQCLCLHFGCHLTMAAARLEVRMDRYSFPVGLFHPLQHAGISRRSFPFSHTPEGQLPSGRPFANNLSQLRTTMVLALSAQVTKPQFPLTRHAGSDSQ